ncbi:MAG: RNA pyrophosphohydrolase [Beggiatoa sp. IS2]|nr:MAG: RNA pyrophosphohydrolase [Beggiatoa sp. IS2]
MIDTDGYRLNVGIILTNRDRQVFWAKRVGQEAWQFPQGGMKPREQPKQALLRELYEEIGLATRQVHIVGSTRGWLRYQLPSHLIRYNQQPLCVGQKQIWFLLRFLGKDSDIKFDKMNVPEFDGWNWVDYWYPLQEVVYFKKKVYESALKELASLAGKKLPQNESIQKICYS